VKLQQVAQFHPDLVIPISEDWYATARQRFIAWQ
jgi:hypothetical protein